MSVPGRNGLLVAGGLVLLAGGAVWLAGGASAGGGSGAASEGAADLDLVPTTAVTDSTDGVVPEGDASVPRRTARATFAGGCFWCMEPPFDDLDGVRATTSGFAGGTIDDPSYREVASGETDHREVVQVTYDPSRVSYTRLLEVFWHNIDPTDGGGQFCDRGHQYTTAVYHHNGEQRRLARDSRERLERAGVLDGEVVTEIAPLDDFWPVEEYHQDFYRKNPERYESYREGCGRDRVLREIWGDAAGH
jgi:peptide-methionine (S)-S-oxide reductase